MDQTSSTPSGEFLLYQSEDGQARVECRFEEETLWLSQALLAELFDRDVRTINEHLKTIYSEGELSPEATIRKFRIVRQEGTRQVNRLIEHYNLEAIRNRNMSCLANAAGLCLKQKGNGNKSRFWKRLPNRL